jgi:hypothetical protein
MMSQAAFAETYDGGTYSFDGSKISNSKAASDIDKAISNLQPGDSMTFTFTYKNDSDVSTEWYLENQVVTTLEEQGAVNGGYTYELINNGKKEGTVTIFSSKAVAGQNSENPDTKDPGLKSATNATQDWLYIDTLAAGQSGTTTLTVALDGESQANIYENKNGRLRIAYAVEKTAVGEDIVEHHKVVNTGDETNLFIPVAAFVGAAILLSLAILSYRRDRKDGEEA